MLNIKTILLKKLDSYLNPQFEKWFIRKLLLFGFSSVFLKSIFSFITELNIPYNDSHLILTVAPSLDIFLRSIGTICIIASIIFYTLYILMNKRNRKVKVDNRFFKNDTLQSTLIKSIERELEKDIISDIKNNVSNIYVIKGEEGVGKSILSFQIADKLEDAYIIKYFYSYEWTNIKSVYELLNITNNSII